MGGLVGSIGGLVGIGGGGGTDLFRKGSRQSGRSEGISMKQDEIATRQQLLAEEQAALTKPIRQHTSSIMTQFLNSGQTPGFLDLGETVTPLAGLSLPGLESEQLNLRRQLMAQGNRGGALQQARANSAIQGGIQRSGLQQQDVLRQEQRNVDRSNIARTLFGGAADMGTGGLALAFQGLGQSMQGLGNAANNLNSLGGQRVQQNQQFLQSLGQMIGSGGGAALMGKSGGGGNQATAMKGQAGMGLK